MTDGKEEIWLPNVTYLLWHFKKERFLPNKELLSDHACGRTNRVAK